jgi:hypothetical protein
VPRKLSGKIDGDFQGLDSIQATQENPAVYQSRETKRVNPYFSSIFRLLVHIKNDLVYSALQETIKNHPNE